MKREILYYRKGIKHMSYERCGWNQTGGAQAYPCKARVDQLKKDIIALENCLIAAVTPPTPPMPPRPPRPCRCCCCCCCCRCPGNTNTGGNQTTWGR